MALSDRISDVVVAWLSAEAPECDLPRDNFQRLSARLQPADVLLVVGRSRIAGVIQAVTLSSWSHAALYVGRRRDLPPDAVAHWPLAWHDFAPDCQLLMEAELGQGVRLVPLDKYREYHARICRPRGLLASDAAAVVRCALQDVGLDYDVRQILDLLRFFFPYAVLPRRWRSTLFETRAGTHAATVCSSMIGRAFAAAQFPVLPVINRNDSGQYIFYRCNVKLLTPRDFDVSPYFDIIKYPFFGDDDVRLYRDLAWNERRTAARDASDK